MPPKQNDEDSGVPITSQTLYKWGGLTVAIGGAFVTVMIYFSTLNTKMELQARDIENMQYRLAENDKASQNRHDQQEKEIVEVKAENSSMRADLSEVKSGLREAVVILKRLDLRDSNSK